MNNNSQYLPPEWYEQSGVMLTWPHDQGDWADVLDRADKNFVEMAVHISHHEHVIITCRDDGHLQYIRNSLAKTNAKQEHLHFHIAPSNDVWVRDYGPLTVIKDGKPVLYKFTFNAWGNKYNADFDNAITTRLHELSAFGDTPMETIKLILEGGSIEVNGAGTLLTTTHCLLSPQRNPQLDCDLIEAMLEENFGVKHFLWLKHGMLEGDDTDGHIDTLARFCDENTILYVTCDDPTDSNYEELQKMQAELRAFRTPEGNPYNLVTLPSPAPVYNAEGRRLPATYANFLIINKAVLAPVYNDPMDEAALKAIALCFPDREIIPIDCLALVEQNGSLHCATMQLPAGVL